jgi:hypothetical protein
LLGIAGPDSALLFGRQGDGKKKGADSGIDGWRYMVAGRNCTARGC